MIDKFSTQFIRIFSRPLPPPPVIGLDDDSTFDAIESREDERRQTWREKREAARVATAEALERWQYYEDQARRARWEYIDLLSISNPALFRQILEETRQRNQE